MLEQAMSRKIADLSDAELTEYSKKHILYEIHMLAGSANLMACDVAAGDPGLEWALGNSRVESFAIHTRNLVDFLYPRHPCDTDVTAAAFLLDGTALRPMTQELHTARRRADKEVAHLTTSRRDDGDPGKLWAPSLLTEIFRVLDEFARAAIPSKLDVSIGEYVRPNGAQV